MKTNGFFRVSILAVTGLVSVLGLGACSMGDGGSGLNAGPAPVDTRATAVPGSVMPAVGGSSNGGGISGGGAGTGSIGGGR